ncbi:MAG: DUF1559 domain-containing protein, partial [Planctomycetaceae bacterium]|nr:DUF1559 domain-containing protein [Planctomycetaceae bacterium]
MKKQFRFGFTLVELLVVISIISMLAAMLLPAVNAAREAGRRATCMNNQSQLALACVNYDSAKQTVPPMRGEIGRVETGSTNGITKTLNVTSWIGFLLPYMEYNQLYQNLREVKINAASGSGTNYVDQLIRIKSLLCPSADIPEVSSGTHYVCNGGYQNAYAGAWGNNFDRAMSVAELDDEWEERPFDPGKLSDAVFFDYRAGTNAGTNAVPNACTTKCSLDYISSHGGTSNVLLLSENERPNLGTLTGITEGSRTGATWAFWRGGTADGVPSVDADGEDNIAFCFPIDRVKYKTLALINPTTSPPPTTLVSNDGTDGNYRSYDRVLDESSKQKALTPLFINQGRGNTTFTYGTYRRARPSSNHPGIVVAAFADRSVKPLNENMDKKVFIWICQ